MCIRDRGAATADAARGAALAVRGVNHRFDLDGAALPVLDDIDLEVRPGEFVALLGPSCLLYTSIGEIPYNLVTKLVGKHQ